jgi:hypothetical protein
LIRASEFTALALVALAAAALPLHAVATAVEPSRDDEVLEILPAMSGGRAELKRLRLQQAANPKAVGPAVSLARRHLDEARQQGDPRYAGLAFAVLASWQAPANAPDDVLLLQAHLAAVRA